MVLKAHNDDLGAVSVFKYYGRLLSYNDDDWPAVSSNLRKARAKWARLSKVLSSEGVSGRLAGRFYVAVVQSVLLFGSETWVITPRILQALQGFHHRIARRLSGLVATRGRNGTWDYPLIAEALERAGLSTIEEYILRRQNTIAAYVATRPIYDIARLRWWNQEGLVFEGMESDIDWKTIKL